MEHPTSQKLLGDMTTVHLVGIGGIGVSALARFFSARGAAVSGSDGSHFRGEEALKEMGIRITIGHDGALVSGDVECLIYSPAISEDNPERAEAHRRGIPEFSYPEALGALMKDHYGIAVSGTNGKTTTTALLGLILEEAGKDPTVVVGGIVPEWQGNFRFGQSDIFLAEGCEYRRHMLKLSPQMIVLTNIEEDHLDYYKDIEDIKSAFIEYIQKLPKEGVLVYNADDLNVIDLCVCNTPALKVSFSLFEGTDVYPKDLLMGDGVQSFTLVWRKKDLGTLSSKLPGTFNVANILAASAAALSLGVSFGSIARAVEKWSGVERRFERVGEYRGALVISDYAHHPTSVQGTIDAAREFFPGRRIIAVFQPHQTDRTKKLFQEFVESLRGADELILAEIYQVLGREEEGQVVSSRDLAEAINTLQFGYARYAESIEVAQGLVEEMQDLQGSIILVMGAGDVDLLARKLVRGKVG